MILSDTIIQSDVEMPRLIWYFTTLGVTGQAYLNLVFNIMYKCTPLSGTISQLYMEMDRLYTIMQPYVYMHKLIGYFYTALCENQQDLLLLLHNLMSKWTGIPETII